MTFDFIATNMARRDLGSYNGIADSVNAYQVTRARQDFGEELFCKLEVETQKRCPTDTIIYLKRY